MSVTLNNIWMTMHTGDKPYTVAARRLYKDICKRETYEVVLYLRVHTGEKPYKCAECDQSFTQSNWLMNHLRIHTGDKPFFNCPVCGKSFAVSGYLKQQAGIHTGNGRSPKLKKEKSCPQLNRLETRRAQKSNVWDWAPLRFNLNILYIVPYSTERFGIV